jgi:hypothetical protein
MKNPARRPRSNPPAERPQSEPEAPVEDSPRHGGQAVASDRRTEQRMSTDDTAAIRSNALFAGIAAALMLWYGFANAPTPTGLSESAVYDASVYAVRIGMQIGGIGLLAAAAFCTVGLRAGLVLDALVSAVFGAVFLLIGLYWMLVDRTVTDLILAVFGGVLLSSAVRQWGLWSSTASWSRAPKVSGQSRVEEPPPETLPRFPKRADAHEPPEGYLAALGRAERNSTARETNADE